jgi:hypothetical protein
MSATFVPVASITFLTASFAFILTPSLRSCVHITSRYFFCQDISFIFLYLFYFFGAKRVNHPKRHRSISPSGMPPTESGLDSVRKSRIIRT